MRSAELIFLVCILLFACVGSNAVARKSLVFSSDLFDEAKKKSTNEVEDDEKYKCKWKTFRFGQYLCCSDKNNTASDDKRVVPTGPNPLHNRLQTEPRTVRKSQGGCGKCFDCRVMEGFRNSKSI